MPDFTVRGGGTLYILTPLTIPAREWVAEHISDDAQTWGGGIAVEHRYINAIVEGARADGLEVA